MLKEKVVEYFNLKKQSTVLEKNVSELNAEIKQQMKNQNITEFKYDGYVAAFNTQQRNSLNNEKLLSKLIDMDLTQAIKTIQIPDEQVIEDMIYNGELDPVILQDCTEIKYVEVLKITYKKAKGGK